MKKYRGGKGKNKKKQRTTAFTGRAKTTAVSKHAYSVASKGINPPQQLIKKLVANYQDRAYAEAESLAVVLTEQFPNYPLAWKVLGAIYYDEGRFDSAIDMQSRAISLAPGDAENYTNLGSALMQTGKLEEAVVSHRSAIKLRPQFPEAHSNLADSLRKLRRFPEAEASCRRAIELAPSLWIAHVNLGSVLLEQNELSDAISSFKAGLALNPRNADVEAQLIHQRGQICDFSVSSGLSATAQKLGISTAPIKPFFAFAWADDPGQHLLRTQVYVRETFKQPAQSLPFKPSVRPARLKIGYFSADFHNFPGMYLMAGLLESHDREQFEVYAFSYGPDKDDAMRRRIVAAVDHFIDIREMSTQEVVDLSREHGIDIALHRNGHTKGSRTELFQHRLAPVQISYLGYPGTLGADFIDYLVADPVVIPEEERQYYSEKIIYLPDTYQPNDNTRQIAETNTTRADFGLPEEGFVLCCFNQNYKISPREFDIWMRVLGQVKGSVLWLLKSNRWAEENLKKEAEHRGIDPSRVIFAERVPHAEHLARHKHADLFVDTFNYNAHTTASDALWSGLPVVTKQGRQFAARVAASLLTAVGLPELITESEDGYERLILELAANPEKLSAIRETLRANRHTEPLFDTRRYTRQLEEGLDQAYQQYFEGGELSDIWINSAAETGIVHQDPPRQQLDTLLHFFRNGRLEDAEPVAIAVTDAYPGHPLAWKVLAAIYGQTGRQAESVRIGRTLVMLSPADAEAHNNLGSALERLGDLEEASESFRKAIAISSNFADAHFNLGVVQRRRGQLEEAGQSFSRVIELDDKNARAYNSLGVTLGELGQGSAAESSYRNAIECNPQHAGAHRNLGKLLEDAGRYQEAEASYRAAIQIDPDFAYAYSNLADVLKDQGKLEEAESSCRHALSLNPDYGLFHATLGVILQLKRELIEAILSYHRSLDLGLSDADAPEVQAQLIHQRRHICDFSVSSGLSATAQKLGISTARIAPFVALAWADDPGQHLLRTQVYVRETFKQPAQSLPFKPSVRPARLKIGYFSADFHNFPGMYLMAGLLESHDREQFEVYAFSYGPDKDDAMRRRIVAAVDHFIDIREMSTQEVVDLSREHGIDIALHRNGHTKGSRTELFQHRLAPVQISYLGYPGTLGADFIDYLVADPVVIPEEERQYYSEKIIYLPDTYQPNDNTRQIAETNTTRADFGLPEEGFVLCCFNQNYKISPREFDIWMRVLGQVKGSVLWLLKSNRWAEENLKKEAEHRGIDPSRVIFAERVPHAEHLARHKHADLFVDTFNYNAHTTASDALWSGLPVVTKQGRQFAARVAASLLTAVGLPELITESEEDYERLILELANNPKRLSAVREKLSTNRHTEPLFDTHRYARHLETGFDRAYAAAHSDKSDCLDIWIDN